MDFSNSDIEFIKKNIEDVHVVTFAQKYKLTPIEFCKFLRTWISTFPKDFELQYMIDCETKGVPIKKVMESLGITSPTQFSQMRSRHGFKQQLRSLQNITLEDVVKNTKWLIEDELKIEVDDFLPRTIKQSHFANNGLSDCLRFANIEKKKSSVFEHFSAVAFLVCHSYPEIFRPYQFLHGKTNNYFKGRYGKRNYINELAWVIENKMLLKLENIDTYVSNNTFLRSKNLSFFGLGYHTFKNLFSSVDEIKEELLKNYGKMSFKANEKSDKLRKKLTESGFSNACMVEKCEHSNSEVHHIIPKSEKRRLSKYKIEFDSVENLALLCPNHHDVADRLEWKPFLKVLSVDRREMLLDILYEKDKV